MKRAFALFCLLLAGNALPAQQPGVPRDIVANQITLPLSSPPQIVSSGSARVVGNPGNGIYYYWVVANFPIGNSSPAGPFVAINAPAILSSSDAIQVSWSSVPGTTSYDVLRTDTPWPPSGMCNCAIATDVITTTIQDQGGTPAAYTVMSFDPNAETATIDNSVSADGRAKLSVKYGGNVKLSIDAHGNLGLDGGGIGTGTNPISDLISKGPIVDVRAYGASASILTGIAAAAASSATVTLAAAGDWLNGEGIVVYGAGPSSGLSTPTAPTVNHDTTPGATAGATSTHTYAVVACDRVGGCSAASTATSATVPTSPTSFDRADVFWNTVVNAAYYAIYKDGTIAGWVDGGLTGTDSNLSCQSGKCWWSDRGQAATNIPDVIPTSAPTSAQSDWLATTIQHGGGTTTLTLSVAASTTISGAKIAHDDSGALAAAISAAPAGATILLPNTVQIYSQINVGKTLEFTGSKLSIYSMVRYGLVELAGSETMTIHDLTISRMPMQSDDGDAACLLVDPDASAVVHGVHFVGCATGVDGFPARLVVTGNWFDSTGLPASINLSRGGAAVQTRSNASGNGPVIITGNRIDGGITNAIALIDASKAVVSSNSIENTNAPNNFEPLASTTVTLTANSATQALAHPEIFTNTTWALFYHNGSFLSACLVGSVDVSAGTMTCLGGAAINATGGDIVELRHAGGYGIYVYSSAVSPEEATIADNMLVGIDGFGIYDQTVPRANIAHNVLKDVLRDGPMDGSLSWAAITNTTSNGTLIDANTIYTVGSRVGSLYPGQASQTSDAKSRADSIFLYNCSRCAVSHNAISSTGMGNGIHYQADSSQTLVSIDGNEIDTGANDGIYASGSAAVTSASVSHNVIDGADGNDGIGWYTKVNGLSVVGNSITSGAFRGLTIDPNMGQAVVIVGNSFHANARTIMGPAVDIRNVTDLNFTSNGGDNPAGAACTSLTNIAGKVDVANSWGGGCAPLDSGDGTGAAYTSQTFSNGIAQSAFPSGITANQLSLYAVEIPKPLQASKISYWVNAGDATTTDAYSLGIYNSSGMLIAHTTPVDWQFNGSARTDAFVEGTVTLPAGMYFVGLTGDAATATLYSVCGAQKNFVDFASSSYAATTSGALSASIIAPTLAPAQGCAPYIFLSK